MFNRHAHVLNRGTTWYIVSVEGTYGEKYIEDACDIQLLYLAKDTIVELKQKTTGSSVLQDAMPTVTLIVKPLGLCNMALPDVSITELPDETIPSTSNQQEQGKEPQKQMKEYVITLGTIVPLPKDDMEISPDLLQRDPDITIIARGKPKVTPQQVQTLPCSINLRRLDTSDITK